MSSKITTPGFDQVGSLRKTSSPTVIARLEVADHQDLLMVARHLESKSQAVGLSKGERLELLVEANHARLVAIKVNPHKSKKAKRFKAKRLRRKIIDLRRQQQDTDSL